MICHWKEPAAALQIRENPIPTLSMKALEPLLEQALKIHVGLLHVFPVKMQSCHSAFRPSSIAVAVILPDAAESSLKTSSALRNVVAATSLSPSTTRERIRRVQPSTSRGERSRRSARPSTIDWTTASCSGGGIASDGGMLSTGGPSPPLPTASVGEDAAVSELSLSEAFALASS